MCEKPTRNGDPGYSWDGKTSGVRPVFPPDIGEGDILLFDEPGRCGGLDSHSHHYRVVEHAGSLELLVRHGGGDERHRLSCRATILQPLLGLDSNARYWLLNVIYHAASDAASKAREATSAKWQKAAAEKRIKIRKLRGRDAVKAEIVSVTEKIQ